MSFLLAITDMGVFGEVGIPPNGSRHQSGIYIYYSDLSLR